MLTLREAKLTVEFIFVHLLNTAASQADIVVKTAVSRIELIANLL